MKTSAISKIKLRDLYSSGKSMVEISQILNFSPHKILYWMDKYSLQRRNRSDAMYIKANPLGDPFSIILEKTPNEMLLFGLGLGIYWGEGEKASKHSVRVANSDPYVLLTFFRFLQGICGVKKEKITYSIVCFNDSDKTRVLDYWSKLLSVSREKFGTIVQIERQGKGIYKKKSKYGVCTLTVSNFKLKAWIMGELEKLKQLPT